MKRALLLLGTGLIAALAIPMLVGGPGLFTQVRDFPVSQLCVMFGLMFACWNLNAIRLRLLLAGRAGALTLRTALGIVMSAEFAVYVTPGGTGGPVTLLTLLARCGMRPAQASGVFAADQIIDILFFLSALLAVALYAVIAAININLGWLVGLPALLMLGGLVSVWLLLRHYPQLLRVSGRVLRWLDIHRRIGFGLARRLLHFRNALLSTLRLPRHILLLAFLLGSANWILRYSLLYLAVTGLGLAIDWAWTFLVQLIAMAAGHLTFIPGGAGGTELTSSAMLVPLLGAQAAAAAVLIWRFSTYYFSLLVGGPVFFAMVGRSFIDLLYARRAGPPNN